MRSFFFSRFPFLVGGEELLLGLRTGGGGPGLGAPSPAFSTDAPIQPPQQRRMYPRTAGVERELARAKTCAMPDLAMV